MEGQIKERIQMSTEFEEFVARNNREISEKAMAKGRAEGLAEGRAEGRAEGIAEGRAEVRAEIAATLLKDKILSPEEIERIIGLPIDQVSEAASKYGV